MGNNKVAPKEGGDGANEGNLSARKYMVNDSELETIVSAGEGQDETPIRVPSVSSMIEKSATPPAGDENGDEKTPTEGKLPAVTPRTVHFQQKLLLAEQHMNKSKWLQPLNQDPNELQFDKVGDPLPVPERYETELFANEVDDAEIMARKEERRKKRKKRVEEKNKISVDAYNKQYRSITKKKITMDDLPRDVLDFLRINYFKKLKYMSYYNLFIAILSLCLMIAAQELTWRESDYDWTWVTISIKGVNTLVCCCLCILIYVKYHYMVKQLVQMNRLPPGTSIFGAPKLLRNLFVELCICFYHVPPGCHFTFDLDGVTYPADLFGILMFVRLYLCADVIKSLSGIFQFNACFFGAFTNVKLNWMFGLKTMLNKFPVGVVSTGFTLMLLVLSWSIYLCERNNNSTMDDYWDAIWMTFITMVTVGYGDVVPVTIFGRLVTFVAAITGILFLCLTATVIFRTVELTLDEHRVTDMLEKAKWNYRRRGSAQRVIKRAWELYVCRTPKLNGNNKYNSWIIHRKMIKLFSAINKFRQLKRANPFAERADLRSQMNALMEVKQKQGDLMYRLKSVEGRMTDMMRELVGVDESNKRMTAEEKKEAQYREYRLPDDFVAETDKLVILPQSAPPETDPAEQFTSTTLNTAFDGEDLDGSFIGKKPPIVGVMPASAGSQGVADPVPISRLSPAPE